ncbi:MAG: PilZ domain-containing protein [Acidobacteria bacterium]|nr:PilZ domain-containing protein [Acidobacteriota bacterium]
MSSIIEYERAMLCLDCEAIFDVRDIYCPRCTSSSAFNVSRWLEVRQWLERRRSLRVPVEAELELEGDFGRILTATTDLSLGGFSTDSGILLPAGTALTGRLKLSEPSEFELGGRVVHAREDAGVGVQFSRLKRRDALRSRSRYLLARLEKVKA